jgi:hypothetical protein
MRALFGTWRRPQPVVGWHLPVDVLESGPQIEWMPPDRRPITTGAGALVDPVGLSRWLTWHPTDRTTSDADGVLTLTPQAQDTTGWSQAALARLLTDRPEFVWARRGCCGVEVTMAEGVSPVYAHLVATAVLYGQLRRDEQDAGAILTRVSTPGLASSSLR